MDIFLPTDQEFIDTFQRAERQGKGWLIHVPDATKRRMDVDIDDDSLEEADADDDAPAESLEEDADDDWADDDDDEPLRFNEKSKNVRFGGGDVSLSKAQFELLRYVYEHGGRVPCDELREQIWQGRKPKTDKNIRSMCSNVNKELGDDINVVLRASRNCVILENIGHISIRGIPDNMD